MSAADPTAGTCLCEDNDAHDPDCRAGHGPDCDVDCWSPHGCAKRTPAEPLDLTAIEADLARVRPGADYNPSASIALRAADALLARVRELETRVAVVEHLRDKLVAVIDALPDAHNAADIANARAERDQLRDRVRELETALADAHAETMQTAGELADERTLHQQTIAERDRLRAELEECRQALGSYAMGEGPMPVRDRQVAAAAVKDAADAVAVYAQHYGMPTAGQLQALLRQRADKIVAEELEVPGVE